MERAILKIVLLRLGSRRFEAMQKFRFKPRSCFVPKGRLFLVQRLWKAKLLG